MPTLKHPRIPHVTVDVPEQDVASWEASGWVNTAPAPEPASDEAETLEPSLDEVRDDADEGEPPARPERRKK